MLEREEIAAGEDPRWPRDVEARLKRLSDATLEVKFVLGRTRLTLEQLAGVKKDSLIETSTLSGTRIHMLVNGVLFGEGEIVVVGDRMAFRICGLYKTATI